jgi:2-succinyl-6-hydroxy-2,4-cyclohexadiene-1-carboxylate synthase
MVVRNMRAQLKALALHGFLGDGGDWAAFFAAARSRYPHLDVVTPDLPGHGCRPVPVPGSFAGWVDWVRGLITEPVHLLGYSLGGRLALAVAIAERTSGRVRSLTTLSTSLGLVSCEERALRAARDAALAARLESEGLTAFLREWYLQPLFAPLVERVGLERLLERRGGGDAQLLACALRAAGPGVMDDLRPHLPRLRTAAMMLAGERDDRYVALQRETVATWPRVRTDVVRRAGHALLLEAPAAAAERWCTFLEENGDE